MSPKIPLLKFLKKARKKKPKEALPARPKVPGVSRIGVYGHSSSGKTCFLTMLYEATRDDPTLRLTTLDDETSSELHRNIRMLKGVEKVVEDGRWREVTGERRFPDPTQEETELAFEVDLGGTSLRFSSLDYPGREVALTKDGTSKESLSEYLEDSDCLLLLVQPDLLESDVLREEHLASLANLIQTIAAGRRTIPIPVGVVVTKADLLEGFESEEQSSIVEPGFDYVKTRGFGEFVEGVLQQPRMVGERNWAPRVKELLRRLRTLLEPLILRTPDFQIFLCSATGPLTEGVNVPPPELRPIGIKPPLRWAATRLITKRRLRGLRRFTKWVFFLTLLWIFCSSIPYLIHFRIVFPRPSVVEGQILAKHGLDRGTFLRADFVQDIPQAELESIAQAYERYSGSRTVRAFFKGFRAPAGVVQRLYVSWASKGKKERKLEEALSYFRASSDTLRTEGESLDRQQPEYAAKADGLKKSASSLRDSLREFTDSEVDMPASYGVALRKIEERLDELISSLESGMGALQAKPIADQFETYVQMYQDGWRRKDYNLLLIDLPATLKELREELQGQLSAGGSDARTAAIKGICAKIDKYLEKAKRWETRLMRFVVKGVPPQGDYSLTVSTVSGAVYDGSRYQIRLPLEEPELKLFRDNMDQPIDTYRPGPGYAILALDGKPIEMKGGRTIEIDFIDNYQKDIPKLD